MNPAANRVWDAFLSCGNPDGYTREEAIAVCAEGGCACDEGEEGSCLRCEALEALGVTGPEPRFRVLESRSATDTDDGVDLVTYFVEDWADESDPVPVDPWFSDRDEAQAFADKLNRIEAEKGEP